VTVKKNIRRAPMTGTCPTRAVAWASDGTLSDPHKSDSTVMPQSSYILLKMWQSSCISALPSTAHSTSLTTSLLQCPPYLHPNPTILPTTFTYPLLHHRPDVPTIHPHSHKCITQHLSFAPLPLQVSCLSRFSPNKSTMSGGHLRRCSHPKHRSVTWEQGPI
jgi:hypothetical protein